MNPLPSCVACGRRSQQRLCSALCVREAVHERDRNLRRLRLVRRTGGVAAGASLVERNAELTGALLGKRPVGTEDVAGEVRPRRTTSGSWRRERSVT